MQQPHRPVPKYVCNSLLWKREPKTCWPNGIVFTSATCAHQCMSMTANGKLVEHPHEVICVSTSGTWNTGAALSDKKVQCHQPDTPVCSNPTGQYSFTLSTCCIRGGLMSLGKVRWAHDGQLSFLAPVAPVPGTTPADNRTLASAFASAYLYSAYHSS